MSQPPQHLSTYAQSESSSDDDDSHLHVDGDVSELKEDLQLDADTHYSWVPKWHAPPEKRGGALGRHPAILAKDEQDNPTKYAKYVRNKKSLCQPAETPGFLAYHDKTIWNRSERSWDRSWPIDANAVYAFKLCEWRRRLGRGFPKCGFRRIHLFRSKKARLSSMLDQ